MKLFARKTFAEFKSIVPKEFYETGESKNADSLTKFREVVGDQIRLFKATDAEKTWDQDRRNRRWKDWIEEVPFDKDLFVISDNITDDTIGAIISNRSGSNASKSPPDMNFYVALYYRFHAHLTNMSYADAIDMEIFRKTLRSQQDPVFVRILSTDDPFIHPPYKSESYVRKRLQSDPADGIWLDPHNHHSIKLSGREKEKRHLDAFVEAKGPFAICPVVGPSGAGKTRLISEWMKKYVAPLGALDWDAGLVVSRDVEPWEKWKIERNTLLVIDYTFAYGDVVKKIAERARSNPERHKVRLIVIDHVFPRELFSDTFWQNLYVSPSIEHGEFFVKERFDTLRIEPEDDQSKLLREIVAAVARNSGNECDGNDPAIAEAVSALCRMGSPENPGAVRHPLFAALAGHALGAGRDITHWNRRALMEYYFSADHRLPWKAWTKDNDRKRSGLAVGALVSAATLRRGLPLSRVRRKLPGDPNNIIQYASRVVSSDPSEDLEPFEPDLLGEAFALKFLEEVENREADEDKRWAWDIFISMLQLSEGRHDTQEVARNILETVIRLIRNLLNDDQQTDAVKRAWNILDGFLEPEMFPPATMLRQVVSVSRAYAVKQCRGAGNDGRATQFARDVDLGDMRDASSGPFFIQAAIAVVHYFEWRSLHGSVDGHVTEALILVGRNFRDQSVGNWPGLMLAASQGCLAAAKAFRRELDEDINARDKHGRTVLIAAAYYGRGKVCEWLLENGANANQRTTDMRWTPLMAACRAGQTETARMLIENGAVVNATIDTGDTALTEACRAGHAETVRMLINSGAECGQSLANKVPSPLMSASAGGHAEVVRLLFEMGHPPSQHALFVACWGGHTQCVRMLLDKYYNAYRVSSEDITAALHYACVFDHIEIAGMLLENGADPELISEHFTSSALTHTCKNGRTEIARLLLQNRVEARRGSTNETLTALIAACEGGHIEIAVMLLEISTSLDLNKTRNGLTPLIAACSRGRTEMVKLLIKNGAAPNQATTNTGLTPLIEACHYGSTEIVKLLIENGAAPNQAKTDNGLTPLIAACLRGRTEIAKLLLENGAAPNQAKTDNGLTPLIAACLRGRTEIAKLLIECGVAPNQAIDKGRLTPLSAAFRHGHIVTVAMLLESDPECGRAKATFILTVLLVRLMAVNVIRRVQEILRIWRMRLTRRYYSIAPPWYNPTQGS